MRDNPRNTYLSALAGVVLLGAVVAFAVGVPELGDDTEAAGAGGETSAATSDAPIELPDQLSDSLVAVDLGTLPPELAAQFGDVSKLETQEAAISDGLQDVFGVPGDFRLYAAEDGTALAQVTALDRAPGLFTPDSPPIAPSELGVTRAASELIKVDGAVCSVSWGQDVPEGQEVDPAQKPQAVRCQLGDGPRTYEITAQGLSIDDSIGLLEDLADA